MLRCHQCHPPTPKPSDNVYLFTCPLPSLLLVPKFKFPENRIFDSFMLSRAPRIALLYA